MLRAFTLATKKLLVPRPLSVYIITSDAATSSSTTIQDVRQVDYPRPVTPLASGYRRHPLLGVNPLWAQDIRWASAKKDFQVPDPSVLVCNMLGMLKCVDLACMKDAPSPAFWIALAAGGTQVVVPLLELIGGYCPVMTIFQLHLAAITVASFGGVKWGLAISKNPVPAPTWDTMRTAAGPTGLALLGLLLPYPLGFLTVGGAVVSSLYLDLKSCAYAPWGNAIRLFITITTLAGLFMALTAYLLFQSAENEKNKEDKKDKKDKKDDPPGHDPNKPNESGVKLPEQ